MTNTNTWLGWAEFSKIDVEQQIVEGFATTENPDDQAGIWKGQRYAGDIVSVDAVRDALPDYLQYGAIREMHDAKAAGTALHAEVLDDVTEGDRVYKSPLLIRAKIVDPIAWKKVTEGVYKGFSIGGSVKDARLEPTANGAQVRRITKMSLHEISLVDRPANPSAQIMMWKADMTNTIQKQAAPDKVLASLQELRDEAEKGGTQEEINLLNVAVSAIGAYIRDQGKPEPDGDEAEVAELAAEAAELGAHEDAAEAGQQAGMTPQINPPAIPPNVTVPVLPVQQPATDGMILAAQKVAKAGRVLSTTNAEAMHAAIKSLASILDAAGDSVAKEILDCYGRPVEQTATPANEAAAALAEEVKKLQRKVSILEARPAPGGPVQMVVEKTSKPAPRVDINALRRSAALESDPFRKRALIAELQEVERVIRAQ